jgi:hypothetical protein
LKARPEQNENMERESKKPAGRLLGRWPLAMVRIDCRRCNRMGQYHKAKLIEQYGPDIQMPTLLDKLVNCEHRSRKGEFGAWCPAGLTDAATTALHDLPE